MSIKTGLVNGVAMIEIARPEKKNALTMDMYDAMASALKAAAENPAVRAVLITGQPGIFTSGNDLEDFMQRPPQGMDSPVFRFIKALLDFDKPVVVEVTGAAIGIGTTMLLHCDLVYVADNARLALAPEAPPRKAAAKGKGRTAATPAKGRQAAPASASAARKATAAPAARAGTAQKATPR